jgi:Fe-S cluster assembly iron-binding protein IscA
MLEISSEASQAIRGILSSEGVADDAAFRISTQQEEGDNAQAGFAIAITDEAPPEDQVVEGDDVQVHLEPVAADMLNDKQLDATVTGGEIRFSLSDQTA